jgi:hypothetical protein
MMYLRFCLLWFLIIVIPACAGGELPSPPPAATSIAPTPSVAPATATAMPTATVVPTATPASVLSESGPWLVYLVQHRYEPNETEPVTMAATDGDGSDSIRFTIAASADDRWRFKIAPQGGRIAFQVRHGVADYQIWILKLPEGEWTKLALLSDEARTELEALPNDERYSHSPLVRLVHTDELQMWSPDGRYLAFSAMLDGPSLDLYVYDTTEETTRRITEGSQHDIMVEWSPDSQWVVYIGADDYDPYGAAYLTVQIPREIRAVRIDDTTTDRYLYTVDTFTMLHPGTFLHSVLGWASNDTFVIETIPYEDHTQRNIRVVNVETAEVTMLLEMEPSPLDTIAFDPTSQTVMLSDICWADEPCERVLYRFTLQQPDPQRMMFDEPGGVSWHPEMGLFSMGKGNHLLFFTPEGETRLEMRLPGIWSHLKISPDGKWLARIGADGIKLYDDNGSFIGHFADFNVPFLWPSDSSGFYWQEYRGSSIYRHMAASGWEQEEVVADGLPDSFFALVNP